MVSMFGTVKLPSNSTLSRSKNSRAGVARTKKSPARGFLAVNPYRIEIIEVFPSILSENVALKVIPSPFTQI